MTAPTASEHPRDRAIRAVSQFQPKSASQVRILLAMWAERATLSAADVAHVAGLFRKGR